MNKMIKALSTIFLLYWAGFAISMTLCWFGLSARQSFRLYGLYLLVFKDVFISLVFSFVFYYLYCVLKAQRAKNFIYFFLIQLIGVLVLLYVFLFNSFQVMEFFDVLTRDAFFSFAPFLVTHFLAFLVLSICFHKKEPLLK